MTFTNENLAEATFQGARLVDCVFKSCDLSNAKLLGGSFRDVRFEDSKLIGIDWTRATTLAHPAFLRCVLTYGNFAGLDLRKATLEDCMARELELSETNLAEAVCKGTDFSGSRFHRTNLTKADFRGASNYAMRPADNILKRAKFSLPEAAVLLGGLDIDLS